MTPEQQGHRALTPGGRETTEDILGQFGFRLVWWVQDHWADVAAYAVGCTDTDGRNPEFPKANADVIEFTSNVNQAEAYLTGFVKWDGCTELDMGCPHWCGPADYRKHCALLEHIYKRAFELMGREPEEPWEQAS